MQCRLMPALTPSAVWAIMWPICRWNKDRDVMYRRELLKGSTETLLLSLLTLEPMYGYQMVKEMDRRSKGYFRFKEGTLYSALHRLEGDGFIDGRWRTSDSGQRRRYYYITAKGQNFLESLQEEWKSFSQAANMIIEPGIP